MDRIVQLTFGSGPAACHLLLEFYAQVRARGRAGFAPQLVALGSSSCSSGCAAAHASGTSTHIPSCCLLQGNVILADDKFEVLTLLRSHRCCRGSGQAAHPRPACGRPAGGSVSRGRGVHAPAGTQSTSYAHLVHMLFTQLAATRQHRNPSLTLSASHSYPAPSTGTTPKTLQSWRATRTPSTPSACANRWGLRRWRARWRALRRRRP